MSKRNTIVSTILEIGGMFQISNGINALLWIVYFTQYREYFIYQKELAKKEIKKDF